MFGPSLASSNLVPTPLHNNPPSTSLRNTNMTPFSQTFPTPTPFNNSNTSGIPCIYSIELLSLANIDQDLQPYVRVVLQSTAHGQNFQTEETIPSATKILAFPDLNSAIIFLRASPKPNTFCTIPIPLKTLHDARIAKAKLWLALPEPNNYYNTNTSSWDLLAENGNYYEQAVEEFKTAFTLPKENPNVPKIRIMIKEVDGDFLGALGGSSRTSGGMNPVGALLGSSSASIQANSTIGANNKTSILNPASAWKAPLAATKQTFTLSGPSETALRNSFLDSNAIVTKDTISTSMKDDVAVGQVEQSAEQPQMNSPQNNNMAATTIIVNNSSNSNGGGPQAAGQQSNTLTEEINHLQQQTNSMNTSIPTTIVPTISSKHIAAALQISKETMQDCSNIINDMKNVEKESHQKLQNMVAENARQVQSLETRNQMLNEFATVAQCQVKQQSATSQLLSRELEKLRAERSQTESVLEKSRVAMREKDHMITQMENALKNAQDVILLLDAEKSGTGSGDKTNSGSGTKTSKKSLSALQKLIDKTIRDVLSVRQQSGSGATKKSQKSTKKSTSKGTTSKVSKNSSSVLMDALVGTSPEHSSSGGSSSSEQESSSSDADVENVQQFLEEGVNFISEQDEGSKKTSKSSSARPGRKRERDREKEMKPSNKKPKKPTQILNQSVHQPRSPSPLQQQALFAQVPISSQGELIVLNEDGRIPPPLMSADSYNFSYNNLPSPSQQQQQAQQQQLSMSWNNQQPNASLNSNNINLLAQRLAMLLGGDSNNLTTTDPNVTTVSPAQIGVLSPSQLGGGPTPTGINNLLFTTQSQSQQAPVITGQTGLPPQVPTNSLVSSQTQHSATSGANNNIVNNTLQQVSFSDSTMNHIANALLSNPSSPDNIMLGGSPQNYSTNFNALYNTSPAQQANSFGGGQNKEFIPVAPPSSVDTRYFMSSVRAPAPPPAPEISGPPSMGGNMGSIFASSRQNSVVPQGNLNVFFFRSVCFCFWGGRIVLDEFESISMSFYVLGLCRTSVVEDGFVLIAIRSRTRHLSLSEYL